MHGRHDTHHTDTVTYLLNRPNWRSSEKELCVIRKLKHVMYDVKLLMYNV